MALLYQLDWCRLQTLATIYCLVWIIESYQRRVLHFPAWIAKVCLRARRRAQSFGNIGKNFSNQHRSAQWELWRSRNIEGCRRVKRWLWQFSAQFHSWNHEVGVETNSTAFSKGTSQKYVKFVYNSIFNFHHVERVKNIFWFLNLS